MVLLWLLPAVVVTLAAMACVSWLGREGRGEVDRDEALRRMTRALEPGSRRGLPLLRRRRRPQPGYVAPRAPRDPSTGVAVRTTRPTARPTARPAARPTAPAAASEPVERPVAPQEAAPDRPERRAS